MRMTLKLDDDVMDAIRAYAHAREISLGRAASELVRLGARSQMRSNPENDQAILGSPEEFSIITSERVRQLCEQASYYVGYVRSQINRAKRYSQSPSMKCQ
jgi:hypothetical protein